MALDLSASKKGKVLPDHEIRDLIDAGAVRGIDSDSSLVNSGSLDLRLRGDRIWRIRGSPNPLRGQPVEDLLSNKELTDEILEDKNGSNFRMERDQSYVFPLEVELDLPEGISARLFDKSSRGRVGTYVRTLTDGNPRINIVPPGYTGKLYTEVCATAFSEIVVPGETTVPQIRFYYGEPSPIEGAGLWNLIKKGIDGPILWRDGEPVDLSEEEEAMAINEGLLTFTADLGGDVMAYKAKKEDKRTFDFSKRNHYHPENFFYPERRGEGINLHPGDFALIHAREMIRLNPNICAEIPEWESKLRRMVSHYAGMVNPGHGFREDPREYDKGNVVFEVSPATSSLYIQDGAPIAYFNVYWMAQEPEEEYEKVKSTGFKGLESILPKQFRKG